MPQFQYNGTTTYEVNATTPNATTVHPGQVIVLDENPDTSLFLNVGPAEGEETVYVDAEGEEVNMSSTASDGPTDIEVVDEIDEDAASESSSADEPTDEAPVKRSKKGSND